MQQLQPSLLALQENSFLHQPLFSALKETAEASKSDISWIDFYYVQIVRQQKHSGAVLKSLGATQSFCLNPSYFPLQPAMTFWPLEKYHFSSCHPVSTSDSLARTFNF